MAIESKANNECESSESSNNRQQNREKKCKSSKTLSIAVHFLDNSVTTFIVQSKALGKWLFEQVCNMLNLIECDYFGLEYFDINNTHYWIDVEKPITRQLSFNYANPQVYFALKFYTPDPSRLEDELTRFDDLHSLVNHQIILYYSYLCALQIKKDLAEGVLQCNENTASLMASYILQAEIGDFNPDEYEDQNYVTKFKLIPHQDASFEWKVMENHKKHIGQSPAEADINLLETARRCELYGVKLTPVTDTEGVPLNLSVNHTGVLIFQNMTKVNTFTWSKIRKLSFKRKRFLIKLHKEDYFGDVVEFLFNSRNECKNFWKKCIEQHTFFRCPTVKKPVKSKGIIFSRGSSFRYSGRTQQQIMEYVKQGCIKRNQFQRSNSARTSGRRNSDGLDTSKIPEPILPVSAPNLDHIKPSTSMVFDSQRSQSALGCRTEAQEQRFLSTGSSSELKESLSGSNDLSLDAQETICNNLVSHEADNTSRDTYPEKCDESCDSTINTCDNLDASLKSSHATESNTMSFSRSNDTKTPIDKNETEEQNLKKSQPKKLSNSEKKEDEKISYVAHRQQKSRSRKKTANRGSDIEQKRRALSAPRCRHDLIRFDPKANKISPSLFAHTKQLGNSKKSKNYCELHYVLVHSLPSLESFSSQDDTFVDPIEEIISKKVENLLSNKSKSLSMQTTSADELNHSVNTLSSSSNIKEKTVSLPNDDQSDNILENESDFGSFEFSLDCDAKERQSLRQNIIEFYLKAHHPDDFDVEQLDSLKSINSNVPLSWDSNGTLEGSQSSTNQCLNVADSSDACFKDLKMSEIKNSFLETLCSLLDFHRKYFKKLEYLLSQWETSLAENDSQQINVSFKEVFADIIPLLFNYEHFYENLPKLIDKVNNDFHSNNEFELNCRNFETRKGCYLPFTSFVLKPAFHVITYKSILERFLQILESKNKEDISSFKNVVEIVNKFIVEHSHILRNLMFLREGCLLKLSKKGYQQRIFFLFSDILIYCSRSSSQNHQFKIHGSMPLKNIMIEESERKIGVTYGFTIYGGDRALMVAASSAHERQLWIQEITSASFHCANETENFMPTISLSEEVLEKIDSLLSQNGDGNSSNHLSKTAVLVSMIIILHSQTV
ncbi:FERM: RhoGEF and pleckstrin domain-containing protein 1-like isoform X2 [Dinothrombium tinctorium]|uniref:FERM: RhoGEF and pleckstrin domain-containing protein 1-like isoform X2 n=1 Tax=Dinothrombium tinctorium TaxID=1965070 RepID=A0A3S3QA96_9ACAR|nr:FERM: RhoGEF and pleckstrin domain-containing protein 1-like isoform X2 [Dinothrombium tinctorium]